MKISFYQLPYPMLEYLKTKLNEEQYKAAIHTETSALILAWAWSWKTRALTYKIAYLIFAKQVRPLRILAVTFTNKAANEMKERLIALSDEISQLDFSDTSNTSTQTKKESDDIVDFDSLLNNFATNQTEKIQSIHREVLIDHRSFKWIWTFHGTFLKLLKDEITNLNLWYTDNFWIYDSNESMSIIKKILKDQWMAEDVEAKEAKGFISKLKNEGIEYDFYTKNTNNDYELTMAKIYELYQKELMKANSVDFDDLLLLPYLLFKQNTELLQKRQNSFDYIMVDEAQDTNWIQFELMRMISWKNGNITLIGDDFQSIYWRRWALMENFLNVKKTWSDIEIFKLQTNYRSKPHIVAAGSHIIKKNENQYEKDIKPHREWDHKIMVFTNNDQVDEAINIIDLIKKFHDEKWHKRSDFAILYRTNAQSSPFEQILVQEGIPYKIYWAFKFFERKEIKDVISYIKYLINPRDNIALKRIINTPSRKIGKSSIDTVEQYSVMNNLFMSEVIGYIWSADIKLGSAAVKNITWFAQIMKLIENELPSKTPSEIISLVINKIEYKAYLIKEEGSESLAQDKYENIGQLINMAEKYETTWVDWLKELMEEVSLLTDIADQNEENMEAIKLMTVHSSKWLEFKQVFVVWLEESIFPLGNARLEQKLLEEERRLMYVAITRAEDHLFLSHANSRMQRWKTSSNPPSRFIDELPEDLLKRYDLAWNSSSSSSQKTYWPNLNEWDRVSHKLFGEGELIEIRNYVGLVRFSDIKFWLRKIPLKLLKKA